MTPVPGCDWLPGRGQLKEHRVSHVTQAREKEARVGRAGRRSQRYEGVTLKDHTRLLFRFDNKWVLHTKYIGRVLKISHNYCEAVDDQKNILVKKKIVKI